MTKLGQGVRIYGGDIWLALIKVFLTVGNPYLMDLWFGWFGTKARFMLPTAAGPNKVTYSTSPSAQLKGLFTKFERGFLL